MMEAFKTICETIALNLALEHHWWWAIGIVGGIILVISSKD